MFLFRVSGFRANLKNLKNLEKELIFKKSQGKPGKVRELF